MQPVLEARRLRKEFLSRTKVPIVAVKDVDLEIPREQILCIVGPSGCGKTTLLDMLAGFTRPTSGTIDVDGAPVEGPSPERGFVFQQAVLFPWLNVLENVVFGPKARGADPAATDDVARRVLQSVGLQDFHDHYPYQLSGGMRQRVQIARVLVASPALILMDEPYGALDAQTRSDMHELLLNVWDEYRPTIVFITHDVEEALFLADRVIVMTHRPGRIREDIPIPFPRPRKLELMSQPEFGRLRADIVALLKSPDKETEADRMQDA